MELADFLGLGQRAPALRFLVIGGYAVAAHGHTRATFDVDFLARQADKSEWFSRLVASGLELFAESRGFAQFGRKAAGEALDLMFVEDESFERFWESAVQTGFGPAHARVPSLDHLLALKLHALKHAADGRGPKDAADVEMLARRNALDLRDAKYEQLFLKYGTREIYDTMLRLLKKP
jgi:hypothetical protein